MNYMPGPEIPDPPEPISLPPVFTLELSQKVEVLKSRIHYHLAGTEFDVVDTALGQLLEENAIMRRKANPRRENPRLRARRRSLDY